MVLSGEGDVTPDRFHGTARALLLVADPTSLLLEDCFLDDVSHAILEGGSSGDCSSRFSHGVYLFVTEPPRCQDFFTGSDAMDIGDKGASWLACSNLDLASWTADL